MIVLICCSHRSSRHTREQGILLFVHDHSSAQCIAHSSPLDLTLEALNSATPSLMLRSGRLERFGRRVADRGRAAHLLLLLVPDVGLLGLLGASRRAYAFEEAALEYGAGHDAQDTLTVFDHAERPIVVALTDGRPAASVVGVNASRLWIVNIRVLLLRSDIQEGFPATMRLVSITTQIIQGPMTSRRR